MNKQTIRDIDVKGKRVLVRADLNVPMEKARDHRRHANPGVAPDDSLPDRAARGL